MEEKLPSDPSPETGAASASTNTSHNANNSANNNEEMSTEPNKDNNSNSFSTNHQAAAAAVPKPEKVNWHSRKISWGKDQIIGGGESALDNAVNSAFTSAATTTTATNASATNAGEDATTNKDTTTSSGILYQNSSLISGIPAVVHEEEAVEEEEEQDPDVLKAEHIQSLFAGKAGGTYNGNATRRHISSLGNIDLDDILKESPYESEAETYILRAIEDRERTSDGATTENPILGNIPDDAISALSIRSAGSNGGDDDDDDDNHSNDLAGASHGNNTMNNHSNNSPGPRTTASSSRRTSVTVPPMLGRTTNGGKQHHRRNQTMEAQLFGLASAIDAMQAQNWEQQDDVNAAGLPWRSPSPMTISGGAEDTGMLSSAEALQQNASLLYNRGNKNNNRPRLDSGFLSSGGGVTSPDDSSSISEQGSRLSTSGRGGGGGAESQASSRRLGLGLQNLGKSFRHHHKKTDSDFSTGTNNSTGIGNSMNVSDNAPLNSVHLADIEEGREEQDDGMRASFLDEHGEPAGQEQANEGRRRKRDRKKIMEQQIVREFQDFFAPQKTTIILYFRVMFLYISLPLLGISAVLFYWGGCPPTGRLAYDGQPVNGTLWNIDGQRVDPDQASISWWLIYIVRLIVTFTLAKATEKLFIDYLAIRSRGSINMFGPWVTLLLLQSRGWPSTLFLWGLYNFGLLSSSSSFAHHWMYKASIGLFNEENPAGNVIGSEWNHRIQAIAVALGILAAVKRLFLGLYLGKRTFSAYADQLARVMKDILMISEVAALAKDFEREMRIRATRKGVSDNQYVAHLKAQRDKLFGIFDDMNEDGASCGGGMSTADRSSNWGGSKVEYIVDKEDRNPWSGSLSNTQQMRIIQLLGAWEEPVIAERKVEYISVTALLQFRRSMACLHTPFPFAGSFGLADTRENCIQSAQDVYRRLLLNEPDQTELNFETLALLGLQRDGSLNQAKLKEMIRLFRPNRDGSLSILEFVKSIDTVYKEIRMLRASVTNASKIDKSFEVIFNFIFYAVVIVIILSQLGYSPMAMFLSISGVILAFAFMIGSASSKYFEGILFILVRRPYAIGDGIAVGSVESEGAYTGHPFWFVEDVTLFTTSVLYNYTGERATLSNGSLANSRIVNVSRTPVAYMYTLLKFPVDVSHDKLKIFHTALEQFFRNRPREWRSFDSFRATRIDAEAGFIEYMVACTHRLSWVEWTTIHTSKADLINFCSELSKKLGIWYRAPPVPVDLTFRNAADFGAILSQQQQSPSSEGFMPTTHVSSSRSLSVPQEPDLNAIQAMFPPRV